MQRFAPINKMESQADGTIKVWGIASTEDVDSDGEIITADAMRAALPDFMKWGALREMHANIAAGTCLEAEVNSAGQTVICAHVVDAGSVKKVQTGVLKGFSIGGTATSTDPLKKTTITGLLLNEISLVDKPANPNAAIQLWKADMSKHSHAAPAVTGEQLGNEIEAIVKSGALTLADILQAVSKAAKSKGAQCEHGMAVGEPCDKCDGGMAMEKAAKGAECAHGVEAGEPCSECDGGMAIAGTQKAALGGELQKRFFTQEERHDLALSGKAMPDGSFPIEDKEDLKNAIKAHARAKDPEAAKQHIKQRAKEMGLESELPEDWKDGDANKSGAGKDKASSTSAGRGADGGVLHKGAQEAGASAHTGQEATGAHGGGAAVTKINEVGTSAKGPDNANPPMEQPGVAGSTAQPNADVKMLPKQPTIDDLVTFKWGEEEISGQIKEITDGDVQIVTVVNGNASLQIDGKKLIHSEFVGTKVNWVVVEADNADFTAVKAAKNNGVKALQKMSTGGVGKPIQKGMWTVSEWSSMLQECVWLYKDIQWEGDAEEDPRDRDVAKKLALWIKEGAALWLEYAQDEIQEMLTGIADPDNQAEFILELAAKPGELKKFAEGASVGHILQKAVGAGSDSAALAGVIEKAVSSAVAAQVALVQKAADVAVGELQKRVKELENQPAAPRGVLKTVGKDSNLGTNEDQTIEPIKKADGSTDDAATAIKKAFQTPQSFNRLSTQ